jgi:uncharacterized C2H2 Zn-finger protein
MSGSSGEAVRKCPLCDLRFSDPLSVMHHLHQYHRVADGRLVEYINRPVCPRCRNLGTGLYVKSISRGVRPTGTDTSPTGRVGG